MTNTVRITGGACMAVLAACALAFSACLGPSAITRGESLFSPAKQKAAEAATGKELWRTPLGGTGIVEDLVPLPDGKLLVALRQYGFTMPIRECLLVDGSDGKVLWKHERTGFSGNWRLLVALPGLLVFQVDGEDRTSVVVLDAATGAERWTHKSPLGTLVRPIPDAKILIALESAKKSTVIAGYDMASGAPRWKREVPFPLDDGPAPILLPDGMILFLGGAESVRAIDGETQWKREKMALDPTTAPPVLTPDGVWTVTRGKELTLFDPFSGDQVSSFPLPSGIKVTNLYRLGKRLLLRGVQEGRHITLEMDRKAGKPLWTYNDSEPSISNLLEDGGNLIFATPTSLVALDRQGRKLHKTKVTELGQDFPVRIRKVGDKVIFIGEMVVAAFDAATGRQAWWNGIDPIHQDADTDALRRGIDRASSGAASFGGGGGSGWKPGRDLARQYQAEAEANFREWRTGAYVAGNPYSGLGGPLAAYHRGRINTAFSRAQSQMDFQFAMMDLGKQLNVAANRFFHEERRDYYLFIQRGIFQAYPFAETKGYVLRPSRKGEVVGVTAIQLATGKRHFTPYGPQHELFGLWNLPDEEKGVVIHEALRPDVSTPGDDRGYRRFVNYLIATQVDWPR
jgi:outer membrane protein assembly factor BamB